MFEYLNHAASKQLSGKIEQANYNEKDLMEVKVRLNMPYYNVQSEFESFEGEIVIDGNHYNFVKRKVAQDTLFLLCLPNKQKDELEAAKTDYDKKVTDFGDKKSKEETGKKENSFAKYQYCSLHYTFTSPQLVTAQQPQHISLHLPQSFLAVQEIPPELNG